MDDKTAPPFVFCEAQRPLLLSLPHEGAEIPPLIAASMTDAGRSSWDTDWFLDRLYDFHEMRWAGRIAGRYSRYVIDLNRPREDASLYPGRPTTGLIPRSTFAEQPIYQAGQTPDEAEREQRILNMWQPYHDCLRAELTRLREKFGFAVLFEGHSIASQVPLLFQGTLPDLNFGTHHGQSCAPSLTAVIRDSVASIREYSHVFDGRFVGGYITRNYGLPSNGIHAVQLELSQATHLVEETKQWAPGKVERIQPVLRSIVRAILEWIDKQ